jgi:hypothetical protein
LGNCKVTGLSDLIEDFEEGPLKLILDEHETEGNTGGKGLIRGVFPHFEEWMDRVHPILSKRRRDFLRNRQGSILLEIVS